jgi:hypothetical protein
VEIPRAAQPSKTPKKKKTAETAAARPGKSAKISASSGLKGLKKVGKGLRRISARLTPGRAAQEEPCEPTSSILPASILTEQDTMEKFDEIDLTGQRSFAEQTLTVFIADQIDDPVPEAAGTRQLLDFLVLVSYPYCQSLSTRYH